MSPVIIKFEKNGRVIDKSFGKQCMRMDVAISNFARTFVCIPRVCDYCASSMKPLKHFLGPEASLNARLVHV